MAKTNGFPKKIIQEMKDREIEKLTRQDNANKKNTKTIVTNGQLSLTTAP